MVGVRTPLLAVANAKPEGLPKPHTADTEEGIRLWIERSRRIDDAIMDLDRSIEEWNAIEDERSFPLIAADRMDELSNMSKSAADVLRGKIRTLQVGRCPPVQTSFESAHVHSAGAFGGNERGSRQI